MHFSVLYFNFEFEILKWLHVLNLSYQFGLSLVLIQNYCYFLFKICIKQSCVQNFLPTSKMELFVTIGIGKVPFCWLMILKTQYPPLSIFCAFSSSVLCWFYLILALSSLFQLVPGGSSSFQFIPQSIMGYQPPHSKLSFHYQDAPPFLKIHHSRNATDIKLNKYYPCKTT